MKYVTLAVADVLWRMIDIMKKYKISFIDLCRLVQAEKQPMFIECKGRRFKWDVEDYYSEENDNNLLDIDSLPHLINAEIVVCDSILDEAETNYLRNVIRPFYEDVISIEKDKCNTREAIYIHTQDSVIKFPNFKAGTMYKGMELRRSYTPEELGIKI